MPLLPGELPKLAGGDLVRVPAPVGLDAPAQIGASPRRQAIASRGLPEEADQDFYLDVTCADLEVAFVGASGVA